MLATRKRIVVAAVALVVGALTLGAGPSIAQVAPPGDTAARPGSWRGSGAALGVRAYVNTEPRLLPVDDVVTLHFSDAQTTWDSTGDANARASSVFPGQTVVGLPDLLTSFGVPQANELLPAYPLTAFASPTAPDVTTEDGSSRARVDPSGEFIEAEGNLVLPGLTDALSPFLDIGPASASSRQSFEDGALVSRASASLGEVSVLGGLVRIGAVEVGAEVAVDEEGAPRTDTSVSVGNVSILGVPVALRAEGIEVGGFVIPPGGFPDGFDPPGIAGRINDLVSAVGLRIGLLEGTTTVNGRTAEASASAVLIEANVPVSGPLLPSVRLDQLPINPNDLVGSLLPLPLPDLDLNLLYRNYIVSIVVGEARAVATAGPGLDSLPASSATAGAPPSVDFGSLPTGGTSTGPSSTERSTIDLEPATTGASSLVLLAERLGGVLAGLVVFAVGGLLLARASTSPLRTPGQPRHNR